MSQLEQDSLEELLRSRNVKADSDNPGSPFPLTATTVAPQTMPVVQSNFDNFGFHAYDDGLLADSKMGAVAANSPLAPPSWAVALDGGAGLANLSHDLRLERSLSLPSPPMTPDLIDGDDRSPHSEDEITPPIVAPRPTRHPHTVAQQCFGQMLVILPDQAPTVPCKLPSHPAAAPAAEPQQNRGSQRNVELQVPPQRPTSPGPFAFLSRLFHHPHPRPILEQHPSAQIASSSLLPKLPQDSRDSPLIRPRTPVSSYRPLSPRPWPVPGFLGKHGKRSQTPPPPSDYLSPRSKAAAVDQSQSKLQSDEKKTPRTVISNINGGAPSVKKRHALMHVNLFGGTKIEHFTQQKPPPPAQSEREPRAVSKQASEEIWKKKKKKVADGMNDAEDDNVFVVDDPVHGWKVDIRRSASETRLTEKYGWCSVQVIGRGANSIVKVCHKVSNEIVAPGGVAHETLFAVKEFRPKRSSESFRSYIKKLAGEFCISSSLHHPNIVETVDLLECDVDDLTPMASATKSIPGAAGMKWQNRKSLDIRDKRWCEVMEYCPGGDLCTLIQHGALPYNEANCYFAQLLNGVEYIHTQGVAHRDLKPENLMLDSHGTLKISDFGEAEVVQSPWESEPHKSRGVCGSGPYIAPEEFTLKEFDARSVDVWSCGIIYLSMLYNRIPWRQATSDDPNFRYFLSHRLGSFPMIDRLPRGARNIINQILDPNPKKRASMQQIKADHWIQEIECCVKKRMEKESMTAERIAAEREKEKVVMPVVVPKVQVAKV